VQIMVYNPIGSIIIVSSIQKGKHTIDLSQYSNGIYLVKTISDNHAQTFRVVKSD
jgi:hypothetical protein